MDHFFDLLNISKHEASVLRVLDQEEPLSVSRIAAQSKVPRMSVYLALASLKGRGLIYFKRKGKRRFWFRHSDKEIASLLGRIAEKIHSHTGRVEVAHGDTGFALLKGLPDLFAIFERIAKGHKAQRLIGIQPTASLRNVLKRFSWDKLQPIQESIRKNKIIIEGLLREDYYPTLATLLRDPVAKKKALESFIGRSTDMAFVSNEYLNSEAELMMFGDIAFLVNWKDEVALEIKNKDMLDFLKELFDLARGYGRKVNQERHIKSILEKLS
jgi:DNA-binding transcriptional ArsR family regulator